jgi:hypothetical protein
MLWLAMQKNAKSINPSLTFWKMVGPNVVMTDQQHRKMKENQCITHQLENEVPDIVVSNATKCKEHQSMTHWLGNGDHKCCGQYCKRHYYCQVLTGHAQTEIK